MFNSPGMFPAQSVELSNSTPGITTSTGDSVSSLNPRWPPSCRNSCVASRKVAMGFGLRIGTERLQGSIAIDAIHADTQGAHLRWFMVAPENHGKGIGKRLLEEAVAFCGDRHFPRIYLWTFEGLHPARHLYGKFGFRLCEQHEGTQWGKAVIEQRFERRLK